MSENGGPGVFELRYDFSDSEEGAYDAILANTEYKNLRLKMIPRKIEELPNEVWFWASLDRIRNLDYILADQNWIICSRRLLEALRSVGDFPHLAIPANFKEAGDEGEGTIEDEYYVLVITEPTDVLDYEGSEFRCHSDGRIRTIMKWAFKSLPQGYPPAFMVKEAKGILLVSKEAKEALDDGGFKGIEIRPQSKIGKL